VLNSDAKKFAAEDGDMASAVDKIEAVSFIPLSQRTFADLSSAI
jgi:hypothetical protein